MKRAYVVKQSAVIPNAQMHTGVEAINSAHTNYTKFLIK